MRRGKGGDGSSVADGVPAKHAERREKAGEAVGHGWAQMAERFGLTAAEGQGELRELPKGEGEEERTRDDIEETEAAGL